jgi:hypothetical protein
MQEVCAGTGGGERAMAELIGRGDIAERVVFD